MWTTDLWRVRQHGGRRGREFIVVAALVCTLVAPAAPSPALAAGHLAPMLTLNHTSGPPGNVVALVGSGFTPGPASVLWDTTIRDGFIISDPDGDFNVPFAVPAAVPGPHSITVCGSTLPLGSPCNSGEFEQKASATFMVTVAPPPLPGDSVDYQIIAVEVTQGVRGNIPTRTAPAGPTTLPADDAVHVSNRPTVVRAYPWLSATLAGGVRSLTAYLQVQQPDGTWSERIFPTPRRITPIRGRSLADMRSDATRSFNFVLPGQHTRGGTRTIRVSINPVGADHAPESTADSANNTVTLPGVRFTRVQHDVIDLRVYIADVAYRDAAGNVVHLIPTRPEISRSINAWIRLWPIDPLLLRIRYRYTNIAQNPPQRAPLPPYDGEHPREVSPPIPGYAPWSNQFYLDANPDSIQSYGLHRGSSLIWLAFASAFDDCHGRYDGLGPFFYSAATNPLGGCDNSMRHEAGHAMALHHAGNSHGESAGGSYDPLYPGIHGQVEAHSYGFDVFELRAIPPESASGHTHDFMSYGPIKWVSIYSWEALARNFGAPDINVGHYAPRPAGQDSGQTPSAPTEYLRVSGSIVGNDVVYLDPAFTVTATDAGEATGTGDYTLTLRDRAGQVLAERAISPHVGTEPGVVSFYELVPSVGGVARLEVSRNGQVIGIRAVSSEPPSVRLLSPAAGDRWGASGEMLVRWEGSDPGGDRLTYRVQVSPDGQSWHTVHGDTTQTQAPISLAHLPGSGSGWRVRVQASDGLNVATADVGGQTFAAQPPMPTILTPADHAFIGTGESLDLIGQAYDVQDDHLSAGKLQWLLDGKPIGTAESTGTGPLPAGEHKLALRATNSAGLSGTTEITVLVGPDNDHDRLPDAWETSNGLSPNDPEDAAKDIDADGFRNWQEYGLASDPRNPEQPGPSATTDSRLTVGLSGEQLPSTVPAEQKRTRLLLAGAAVAALLILAGGGLYYLRLRRKRTRAT